MESRCKFSVSQKRDARSLAQGLFESKVLVQRPPSEAQKNAYNASRCHSRPQGQSTRQANKKKPATVQSVTYKQNPVWRPFSGEKSLSKLKPKVAGEKKTSAASSKQTSTMDKDVRLPDEKPRLPKGVEVLEPWISDESFEEWIGVPADANCFVILPCGLGEASEHLPPLQMPDQPLLQRPVREPQKYIPPKILHNYNYFENVNSYQCHHGKQAGGDQSGHSETVPRLRTCEIIRQEIEDLERLLQGYGNPNSSSIVNRYQHDITTLKQMVTETLHDYNLDENIAQETLEGSGLIQGDLFDFLAKHDEVITAIREKRDACVKELARLEQELGDNR